jgi:RNA polymerase sigma factor (TIGR02999 family)
MRRILIENARRRKRFRHGGALARQPLREDQIAAEASDNQVLAVDDALEDLKAEQPVVGQLVELRYFGGLTVEQAADVLRISTRSANRYWIYAKAWLTDRIQ